MDRYDEQYENLKAGLDRALQFINWDEDYFYESVNMAHHALTEGLKRMKRAEGKLKRECG